MNNIVSIAKKTLALLALLYSSSWLYAECITPRYRTETHVVCDSFFWQDAWRKTTQTYIEQLGIKSVVNPECDSAARLNLTIVNHKEVTLPVEYGCDEFIFNEKKYTVSGIVSDTVFRNVEDGCDSISFHPFTVLGKKVYKDSLAKCDMVVHNHEMFYRDTTFNDTVLVKGCDSITKVIINVLESDKLDTTAYECGSFNWYGVTYNSSGDQVRYFGKNKSGCDSSLTLHLHINSSSTGFIDAGSVCDSFWWDRTGKFYNYSCTMVNGPKDTIKKGNIYHCDSIITLLVHINVGRVERTIETVCDSFLWHDEVFYKDTLISKPAHETDINGCDSSLYLRLSVNYSTRLDSFDTACNSYIVSIGRISHVMASKSGVYVDTMSKANAVSCDSIIRLSLTIYNNDRDTIPVIGCDSFYNELKSVFIKEPQVILSEKIFTVHGCDSSVYLDVSIQHPSFGSQDVSACDMFQWGDKVFYADTVGPEKKIKNIWGCDSTVTLNLTMHSSVFSDTFAVVCDSILWYGKTYYDGTPTYTFPQATQYFCDSILVLKMEMRHGSYSDSLATVCDSFLWYDSMYYATTLTRSPYRHYLNTQGCDSAVHLYLTIHYASTGDTVARSCDSIDWHGLTYNTNGVDPTFNYVNHFGCDSVVTMHLALRFSSYSNDVAEACGHLIWHFHEYTESGIYYDTTINAAGCDSLSQLILTIDTIGEGSLSGLFEVEKGRYIAFAMGNLQYNPYHNSWRFAEHQYDFIGVENKNVDSLYNGWLDLFGWGTSGYHHPADVTNIAYQPWANNNVTIDEEYNSKGFGPSTFMDDKDFTGFAISYDWGQHNNISNGGTAGQWRTLSADEWSHLLFYRPDAINKRGMATVYGVNGVEKVYGAVLLPESWYVPDNCTFYPGSAYGYATNVYSNLEWQSMQNAGAVFLPAAGTRFIDDIDGQDRYGYYWSSTHYDAQDAYLFYLSTTALLVDAYPRHIGRSVRLAQDVDGVSIPCASYGDTTASVEGQFEWYDEVLTESGDYQRLSPEVNVAGCDSIVSIHLTVSSVGIDNIAMPEYQLSMQHGVVVVRGESLHEVSLYDVQGRSVETLPANIGEYRFQVPTSGVYMLKVGHAPARKLSVIR